METTYAKHDTLPAYELAQWDADGRTVLNKDAVKWGNEGIAPPAIGTRIQVTMNNLGPGTVRGYFTECGWLGLLVEFHEPPQWWVKQNAPNRPLGHIFGIEFKPAEVVAVSE